MDSIKIILNISIFVVIGCGSTNNSTVTKGPLIDQGYGSVEASRNTMAISQIEVSEKESSTITWMELLQRTAGVTVMGQGNNLAIRIRAKKSINGSQEPLFVVNNTPMGQGFQTISFIDPMLVKRISILKDAASASSYGSRGANGVILVTLK